MFDVVLKALKLFSIFFSIRYSAICLVFKFTDSSLLSSLMLNPSHIFQCSYCILQLADFCFVLPYIFHLKLLSFVFIHSPQFGEHLYDITFYLIR